MFTLQKKRPTTKPYRRTQPGGIPDIKRRICVCFICLAFLACFTLQASAADSLKLGLSKLTNGGAVLLNDESGNQLFALNPDKKLIPASLIKFITALAAIDLLGRDFRFRTEFYTDQKGTLGIKGWGDPFLVSEEIETIVSGLKDKGVLSVRQIRTDTSAFSPEIQIPGVSRSLNPYDALNGSLVVNFNTLFLGKTEEGVVYSAEEHTPLTPLAKNKGQIIKPGTEERISLADDKVESLSYVGELFITFMKQAGIEVQLREIDHKPIESRWTLLLRHPNSRNLDFILEGLMKYSNNFIANQIFLVMGAEKLGYPATMEKSREVMNRYLEEKWQFDMMKTVIEEASGISRQNLMSARQLMKVLESFRPYHELVSLKDGVRLKSGTLTDVYNYAGYLETDNGLRPFVIMTHQRSNHRNRLLKMLRKLSESLNTGSFRVHEDGSAVPPTNQPTEEI